MSVGEWLDIIRRFLHIVVDDGAKTFYLTFGIPDWWENELEKPRASHRREFLKVLYKIIKFSLNRMKLNFRNLEKNPHVTLWQIVAQLDLTCPSKTSKLFCWRVAWHNLTFFAHSWWRWSENFFLSNFWYSWLVGKRTRITLSLLSSGIP